APASSSDASAPRSSRWLIGVLIAFAGAMAVLAMFHVVRRTRAGEEQGAPAIEERTVLAILPPVEVATASTSVAANVVEVAPNPVRELVGCIVTRQPDGHQRAAVRPALPEIEACVAMSGVRGDARTFAVDVEIGTDGAPKILDLRLVSESAQSVDAS